MKKYNKETQKKKQEEIEMFKKVFNYLKEKGEGACIYTCGKTLVLNFFGEFGTTDEIEELYKNKE